LAQEKAAAKKAKITPAQTTTPTLDPEVIKQKEAERARLAAEYEEQDWQRVKDDDSSDDEEEEEQGDGTGVRIEGEDGAESFECVACDKTFMTEASWENHERSKKHKQAVFR
jgi:DnaJ family protein A protein 5